MNKNNRTKKSIIILWAFLIFSIAFPVRIFAAEETNEISVSASQYVVKEGDTLWSIAASHGVTVLALSTANNIINTKLIYVGQVLTIPGKTILAEEDTTGTTSTSSTEANNNSTSDNATSDNATSDNATSDNSSTSDNAASDNSTTDNSTTDNGTTNSNGTGSDTADSSSTDSSTTDSSTDSNNTGTSGTSNILKVYNTKLPDAIIKNLKYTQYKSAYDYILINASSANVRKSPSFSSKIIGVASLYQKVPVSAKVIGQYSQKYDTDKWYKIKWKKGDETVTGYVLCSLAKFRTFQFDKMLESIEALQSDVDNHKTAYIANYKNSNGSAPYYHGTSKDAYGILRYQSAPAYKKANSSSEFRYIADGTLITILGETSTYYKISTLNFAGTYYVPKKYVSLNNSIDKLKKVIVIDRKNQNEGVFEYINGKWNMISYVYATTGATAKYKQPTPLGYYMAIVRVSKFLYLDDVTKEIAGYAPYGIRFTGGSYIHGIPVDLVIRDGVKIYPPMQEYTNTIGTEPRSHKCVRNYTSHAKFLYDWITIGKTAVIVIE